MYQTEVILPSEAKEIFQVPRKKKDIQILRSKGFLGLGLEHTYFRAAYIGIIKTYQTRKGV